jgi:hypothetical protein
VVETEGGVETDDEENRTCSPDLVNVGAEVPSDRTQDQD